MFLNFYLLDDCRFQILTVLPFYCYFVNYCRFSVYVVYNVILFKIIIVPSFHLSVVFFSYLYLFLSFNVVLFLFYFL